MGTAITFGTSVGIAVVHHLGGWPATMSVDHYFHHSSGTSIGVAVDRRSDGWLGMTLVDLYFHHYFFVFSPSYTFLTEIMLWSKNWLSESCSKRPITYTSFQTQSSILGQSWYSFSFGTSGRCLAKVARSSQKPRQPFWVSWWPFWIFQAVWCCRRCGGAGGEQVPLAPIGWYFPIFFRCDLFS